MAISSSGRAEGSQVGGVAPMRVGSRLPSLVSRTDGIELRWRDPSRGATVAVFLQSDDSDSDQAYLRGLRAAADDFRVWDGRVIVIMPGGESGSTGHAGALGSVAVVTEPTGEAEHCGVQVGEDAVLIADRWGQVYHGARGASADALPNPAEIEEWLRFISTQCPECGVIDEP